MRRYITILISILTLAGCKQTIDISPDGSLLFQRYYGNGIELTGDIDLPDGRSIYDLGDNGLIAISTLVNADAQPGSYIFKTDKNGIMTGEVFGDDTNPNLAVDLAATGDGNYYILLSEPEDTVGEIMIVKVDDNLSIQPPPIQYKFPYNSSGYSGKAITYENNRIAVLGNFTSGGVEKMFLAQFNDTGGEISTDTAGDSNNDNLVGRSLIAGGNGRYYWCGDDKKTEEGGSKPRFISIDNDGNIKLSNAIEIEGEEKMVVDINEMIRSYDNGFVMAGSITDGANKRSMRMIKLNQAGEYQWHRDFPDAVENDGVNTGVSVCEADAGGFVIAGIIGSTNEKEGGDVYLARYNNNSVVWEKRYKIDGTDETVSKVIRVDGGYVLIGTAERVSTRLITIMRTDLNGNLIAQ